MHIYRAISVTTCLTLLYVTSSNLSLWLLTVSMSTSLRLVLSMALALSRHAARRSGYSDPVNWCFTLLLVIRTAIDGSESGTLRAVSSLKLEKTSSGNLSM